MVAPAAVAPSSPVETPANAPAEAPHPGKTMKIKSRTAHRRSDHDAGNGEGASKKTTASCSVLHLANKHRPLYVRVPLKFLFVVSISTKHI